VRPERAARSRIGEFIVLGPTVRGQHIGPVVVVGMAKSVGVASHVFGVVAAPIEGDAVQPGREAVRIPQVVDAAVGPRKYVLGKVFGVFRAIGVLVREVEDHAFVAFNQGLEGVLVSLLHATSVGAVGYIVGHEQHRIGRENKGQCPTSDGASSLFSGRIRAGVAGKQPPQGRPPAPAAALGSQRLIPVC
jgi:hypothetical protein